MKEDKLQNLMNDIADWSDSVFGTYQRNPAILYHLKEEIDELIAAYKKYAVNLPDSSISTDKLETLLLRTEYEYVDCFMLLLDSATHFGLDADELISFTREKLEINKKRKWGSPDKNGVINHIPQ